MTVGDAKRRFLSGAIWAVANWHLLALAAAVIAGLLVVGQIKGCRDRRAERRIETQKEKVVEAKVEANVAAKEVRKHAENTNIAATDFDRALRVDSNRYAGTNLDDVFCRRYPNDSSCDAWRRLQSTPRKGAR